MRSFSTVLALAATAAPAFAALATTTRYDDGQEGACGCGSTAGAFPWQYDIGTGIYTAAASQVLFDTDDSSWCGAGCGKCYQLTNQGYSACSTCGSTAGSGESIIVMVSNLCPNNGNEQWCPVVGGTNQYGYGAHFDIMSKNTDLVNGSWDNPVVEYTEIPCPGAAATDYEQCICDTGATPPTLLTTSVESSTTAAPLKTSTSSTTIVAATSSTTKSSAPVVPSSTSSEVSSTNLVSDATTSTIIKVTTKAATTSTTSSAVIHTTSSIPANNGTVPLYGQCGGVGWNGGTQCLTGTCVYSNDWYSQCIMTEAQDAVLVAEDAQLYSQCGGIGYTGKTTCAVGSCQYVNDYFSQCLLDE